MFEFASSAEARGLMVIASKAGVAPGNVRNGCGQEPIRRINIFEYRLTIRSAQVPFTPIS